MKGFNFTLSDYLLFETKRKHLQQLDKLTITPEPREKDLHGEIKAHCKQMGWIALTGSMAHRAMRTLGEYDFTIQADGGRVFFVEAKTAKGKLSPEQTALHHWARKLGHTVHVVRSMKEFRAIVDTEITI